MNDWSAPPTIIPPRNRPVTSVAPGSRSPASIDAEIISRAYDANGWPTSVEDVEKEES